MPTKKTKNKPSFSCDVNGSIMVTCALRYSLGRMTYLYSRRLPGSVQDWIKTYWNDLDNNTKCNIIKDVFDHLYEESESKEETFYGGYDLKEWEKFAIDRYWTLDYNSRKAIDHSFSSSIVRKSWYEDVMMKKFYENQSCR